MVGSLACTFEFHPNVHTNISYMFLQCKSLISIDLSGNHLTQSDFEDFSEFLQHGCQLKSINLSGVKMTTENANTLGLGLRKVKGLESIILNNCYLTEENFNFIINRDTTLTLKRISSHLVNQKQIQKNIYHLLQLN